MHVTRCLAAAALSLGCLGILRAETPAFYGWAERPVMGWNSWDAFATTITENQVAEVASIMKQKLAPSGYRLLTVDIQWYEPTASGFDYHAHAALTMDHYGRLIPAPNKFPSGFAELGRKLHAEGLKFGIHVMRGIPRQAVAAKSPVLGTTVTAADIADTTSTCSWNDDMYGVDMAKPGAQAYYNSIVAQYAEWGVDFIKVDDLSRPYHAAEIAAIRSAIDASGRPIVFSTSPGATPVSAGPDIMIRANQWRISDDFWDSWKLLNEQFARLRDWTPYRGPGHFPDADMLPVGTLALGKRTTRFTTDEQQTLMTLWAMARSPLILGADLRKLDAATLALVTNPDVVAIDQESSENRELWPRGTLTAWGAKGRDRTYLAVFNRGEKKEALTIGVDDLGLNGPVRGRNVWSGQPVPTADSKLSIEIASHGCCLVVLEPVQ